VCAADGSQPGRGGVTRGRGDAEMTWGEESQGQLDQFEAKVLDPAHSLDVENSAVLGVGAAAPTVEPVAEGAGNADVAVSTGKSAWRRRLAPHHRDAVKGFFTPASAKKD
jgi:hypothetical protein